MFKNLIGMSETHQKEQEEQPPWQEENQEPVMSQSLRSTGVQKDRVVCRGQCCRKVKPNGREMPTDSGT